MLPASAGGDPAWHRLEADGVVMLSDASRKDATEFLLGYLAYRRAFTELLMPEGSKPGPVCLMLFRHREDLQECEGGANDRLLALTAEVDGEVYVALSVGGDRKEALSIIYETDTVFGLRRLGLFLPLWVEHGMGAVFSTLRVTKGVCVVGSPAGGYPGDLRSADWLPWGAIGEMTGSSAEYRLPAVFRMFIAQSWGAMRAVLLSRPDATRAQFAALVRALRKNELPDEALARVLEIEHGAVPAYLKKSARQSATLTVPFDEAAARSRIQFSPASELDLCVRRASLIQSRQNPERAMLPLLRARELAPKAPVVLEAWARQERANHDANRAAQLYREAVEAGSTNPKALLFSAQQRLNDTTSGGQDHAGAGGVPAQQALEEIRRAIALNPGDGEAYQLMGRALFAVAKPTEADLRELEPGINSPQHGVSVRYYRTLVQQRLGMHEESAAGMRELLTHRQVPVLMREKMLESYLGQRTQWLGHQTEKLLRAADYAQARELVDKLLDTQQWPTAEERYRKLRDWIDSAEAIEQLQSLQREGPPEELRKAGAAFIERFPQHPASQQLRERMGL